MRKCYVYRNCKWNSHSCFYKKKNEIHVLTVKLPNIFSNNLKVGDSISHNGCCLTISAIKKNYITSDIIKETLKITNLGLLNIGEKINVERSAKYGDEIGGHIISGHIINTVKIFKILKFNENHIFWLKFHDTSLIKYIFYKGFIAIDGISLTVGEILNEMFSVHIIPHTWLSTTIKNKKCGNIMNVEIDFYTKTVVDTVERFINKNIPHILKK